MPLFERNQVVLVKIEPIAGIDAVPTGTDAVLCDVVNPTVDGKSLENSSVRNSISAQPKRFTSKTVKASISFKAKGSGTAGIAPEFGPLLQCCALKETVVDTEGSEEVNYKPTSIATEMKTVTIYIYKDGLLIKAVGCMGNLKFSGKYGDYAVFTADIEGIFAGVVDAVNPTATYDSVEPIELKNEGFAFGDWSDAVAREFSFETGNTLVARGNINSATGLMPYIVTARDPQWSSSIEAVLEATNTFWEDYQSRDTVALSLMHGTVPGNIFGFAAPAANFDAPSFSSENSLNMYSLSGQLLEDDSDTPVLPNFTLTFK